MSQLIHETFHRKIASPGHFDWLLGFPIFPWKNPGANPCLQKTADVARPQAAVCFWRTGSQKQRSPEIQERNNMPVPPKNNLKDMIVTSQFIGFIKSRLFRESKKDHGSPEVMFGTWTWTCLSPCGSSILECFLAGQISFHSCRSEEKTHLWCFPGLEIGSFNADYICK